ncbi:hypothetical protein ABVT39_016391 [Epinephelus coioides]
MGRLDCVCEALGKMFDEHAVNGKLTREQLKQLFEKESDMKAKMESGCCEKMKEWMDKNCKDPMDFNDFCSCVSSAMALLDCTLEAAINWHDTHAKKLFDKHAVDGKLTKDQLNKLVQEDSNNEMMKTKMAAGGCERMKQWMEKNCIDTMDFEVFSRWLNMVAYTRYCKAKCQQGGSCAQACK